MGMAVPSACSPATFRVLLANTLPPPAAPTRYYRRGGRSTIMAFPFQFLLETVLPQLLMGKDKEKHSKKDQASADILDVAHLSLKKFRKVTKQIGKLSTGQKLVGGVALLAVGLTYLARQQADAPTPGDAPEPEAAKSRKRKKISSPDFE